MVIMLPVTSDGNGVMDETTESSVEVLSKA
jgi:hypothetical protein